MSDAQEFKPAAAPGWCEKQIAHSLMQAWRAVETARVYAQSDNYGEEFTGQLRQIERVLCGLRAKVPA